MTRLCHATEKGELRADADIDARAKALIGTLLLEVLTRVTQLAMNADAIRRTPGCDIERRVGHRLTRGAVTAVAVLAATFY